MMDWRGREGGRDDCNRMKAASSSSGGGGKRKRDRERKK
jgi:hypothetical protein